jgi:hypothetical protein
VRIQFWEHTVLEYHQDAITVPLEMFSRLRVFGNRVLRGIFGPKREKVAGDWRRLHNEELHKLYATPDVIRFIKLREMRWVGHVALVGEMNNAYKNSVGKPEEDKR